MNDNDQRALVTLDGTDCPINCPMPFDKKWYSYKFRDSGLRYEVAVCINTGYIVWYYGPFPCGMANDVSIYRMGLKQLLTPGERILADKGYRGELQILTPDDAEDDWHRRAMALARTRHETINGRFKNWKVLSTKFRHPREKHHLCFEAVLAVTQMEIANGSPPFTVDEYDDPAVYNRIHDIMRDY